MTQDKSKNYDFEADDPFNDNPLEDASDNTDLDLDHGDLDFDDLDQPSVGSNSTQNTEQENKNKNKNKNNNNQNNKKETSGSGGGILGFLKEYYIYIIGVVVVLVVLYFLYEIIFPSNSTPARPAVAQSQQQQGFNLTTEPVKVSRHIAAASEAKKQSVQPVDQTVPTAPTVQMMSFTQDDLKQLVNGFSNVVEQKNQQLAEDITSIAKAQSKLTAEESLLTQTQEKNIQVLSQKIEMLNKTIDASNENMNHIEKALLKTQSELQLLLAEKAASRDHLTLRAVVPGRAWLVDGAGRTISVGLGDEIQNYGKVERIDDKNPTVIMSSGYVFS